jgi:hypothetical protein
MKKLKHLPMNSYVRTGIQIILILMVAVSLFSLYQAFQSETVIDKDFPACNYEARSNFNYAALLKPNSLFETRSIGQNRTYFTKIIDRIDTIFYYDFTCDRPASINGDYEVVASVNGEDWEKNYVLVPKKEFAGDKMTDFTVKFPVNLSTYNDVVNSIGKEIDVQAKDPELKLIYNINTIASIGSDHAKETLSPTIVIPLGKKAFNITGDLSTRKNGSIFRSEVYIQQDVIEKRIYSGIIAVMAFFLLVLFTRFTKNKVIDKNSVNEIKNKYGDWITEAAEIPTSKDIVKISTFLDLVKIAEELGRPILHFADNKIHWFFVLDGQTMYEFRLNEPDKDV